MNTVSAIHQLCYKYLRTDRRRISNAFKNGFIPPSKRLESFKLSFIIPARRGNEPLYNCSFPYLSGSCSKGIKNVLSEYQITDHKIRHIK